MMRTTKWLLPAFIILGAVLYYLQDQWLTRDIDDYDLSTIMEMVIDKDGDEHLMHLRPVTSLSDAVESQCTARQVYNGRQVNQVLEQWMCATWDGKAVAVFNTLLWALLLTCFILLSYGKDRANIPNMVIALAFLWLLMPNAMKMFMGSISGTANYLWSGAVNLLILLLFDKAKEPGKITSLGALIALGLLSLLAGSMQESFSMGIAAGMVVYALLHIKRLPRAAWVMIACYLVGTAFITLAPANFVRSDAVGMGFRMYVIVDLLKVPVILLFLLVCVITLLVRRQLLFDVFKRNLVIVVAIAVNVVFTVFGAYTGAWQLTCISLLCAVLTLQLCDRLVTSKALRIALACLAACATIAVYCMQLNYRHGMWEVEQAMFQEARHSGDGLISLKQAFDIDAPYRDSRLAPVYRQYLNNPPEILIINNQRNGVSLLSKYLTKCENPDLVKALLPDTPENISRLFDGDGNQTMGNAQTVKLYSFTIARTPAGDEPLDVGTPCQQWEYKGYRYTLYNKPINL